MLKEAPELALYAAPYYPPMTLAPMEELGCSKSLQSWRCIRPLVPTYDPGSDGRVGMLEEAPELALYPPPGSLGEYLHLRVHVDVNAVPVQVFL